MKNFNAWVFLFAGIFAMWFCFSLRLPSFIYLLIAIFAFMIGVSEARADPPHYEAPYVPYPPASAQDSPSAATARVELPERNMPVSIPADLKCPSCGASIKPTDTKCAFCGSNLQPLIDLPQPANLAGLEVGNTIRVSYAQFTDAQYLIRGRLLYTELWQASRGADVPWTPTGNHFTGFVLDQDAYLLNWQSRFYILTTRLALSDTDINRDFLPSAKQFAQSNQTANVEFTYGGLRWHMNDIGRFAIESVEGEGAHLSQGAIGRFIHASSGDLALIIEDFQSGGSGGQDTLWQGYLIKESNIHS